MLDMRPTCECCFKALAPDADDVLICSFECTFCASCNEDHIKGTCPNCGGQLVSRPPRASSLLAKFPASETRVESLKLNAAHHGHDD